MNDYLVEGTNEKGYFQKEVPALSSRDAYLTTLNNGKRIRVVAIKMKCSHCREYHITVPASLYI